MKVNPIKSKNTSSYKVEKVIGKDGNFNRNFKQNLRNKMNGSGRKR